MGGQPNPSDTKLDGQVCIVTGASSGIGLEIARELCRRRATVILACRNLPKAQAAMDSLLAGNPTAQCEVRHLDLASLPSVRHFAAGICADYRCLHGLINNAGVMLTANEQQRTSDGFEVHLQVNYLGAVLLSELLREPLQRGNGRVVMTAAHAYSAACSWISADDPLNIGEWKRSYHYRDAFALSKLLLVLWTRSSTAAAMAAAEEEKIEASKNNSMVTVNAYTPGFVRGTEHLRQSPIMRSKVAYGMIWPWLWLFLKTPSQGAQTAVYMLVESKLASVSGKYLK